MKKIYFLLIVIICLLSTNVVRAQQGETCENPLPASNGTNSFTGIQNNDQWFSYTATQTGKVTVSSCSSATENTQVVVYKGGICFPLEKKAENDNHCSNQSQVSFLGTQGYDYLIVWKNTESASSFDWTIVEEAWSQGEVCNNPIEAVVGTGNESDHSAAVDQWFRYTAPGNGTIKVSTCGLTTENTSVRIYEDLCGIQLDGNDDFCPDQSEVEFTCVENTSYLIKWENINTSGTYNWSLVYDSPTSLEEIHHDYNLRVRSKTNVMEISLPENIEATINLYGMLGSVIKSIKSNGGVIQIDAGDLSAGIYIISISSDLGIWSEKIYLIN